MVSTPGGFKSRWKKRWNNSGGLKIQVVKRPGGLKSMWFEVFPFLGCWEVSFVFEHRVGKQRRGGRHFGVNVCMMLGLILDGVWIDLGMSNQESRIEANKMEIKLNNPCKFTQVHAGSCEFTQENGAPAL